MHHARRIRDLLRGAILAGDFGTGPLPSEPELAVSYGAGRNVIRTALDLLRNEGLVVRIQGSGTFSVARKGYHRFETLRSLDESLTGHVAHDVLALDEVPAPPAVASRLACEVGAPCVFLERLAYVDGSPVSLNGSWFRGDLLGDLRGVNMTADFYSIVRIASGLALGEARIVLEAVPADAGLAELLRIEPGAPALLIDRVLHLADDTPFEWGVTHSSSKHLALLLVTSRDNPGGMP